MSSKLIDINRKRAIHSYIDIENFQNEKTKESQEKMRSYCRKLPAMIKANGLIDTLSYIKSKSQKKDGTKTEYGELYNWINLWMGIAFDELKDKDLIKEIAMTGSGEYRIYTDELLNISLWYKRNAEGILVNEK